MILEVFPLGPLQTNAVLIACPATKLAAIIDAPFESSELLIHRACALHLKLSMILLTHSHWDHMAEASILKEKLDIPLYVHSEDAQNLEVPGSDGLPLFYPIKAVKADHFLFDGEILFLGTLKIKVIHTPGHSPGGVCFYLENEAILISGDTLFQGTCGKVSFPTSNPSKMKHSLKKLSHLPPDTKVYPGHGPDTTIGAEEPWMSQ